MPQVYSLRVREEGTGTGAVVVDGVDEIVVPEGSLTDDGAGVVTLDLSGGGGTPGGSSGQPQWNNAGAFDGMANTVYATSGDRLTFTATAAADRLIVGVAHASQSNPLVELRTSTATVIYALSGGTTTETRFRIAVPSGAGGPAAVQLEADGAARWTIYTSGSSSYGFFMQRFGGSEGFGITTGGRMTVTNFLQFPQVADVGVPDSNHAGLGVEDVAGTAELIAVDEGGVESIISPHAEDAPDSFYDLGGLEEVHRSITTFGGEVYYHQLTRALKLVEQMAAIVLPQLSADQRRCFLRESLDSWEARTGKTKPRRRWDDVQDAHQRAHDEAREREIVLRDAWDEERRRTLSARDAWDADPRPVEVKEFLLGPRPEPKPLTERPRVRNAGNVKKPLNRRQRDRGLT